MGKKGLEKAFNVAASLYHQKKAVRLARRPFKFLTWKILEIVASWSGRPIKISTELFWGENIKIVFPELISMTIFKYGFYEEGLTRIFLENIKTDMVFFDIGAHFGYYSLLGALLIGDKGQVHAFEPTITSYNILRENTLAKNNIKINNLAVSNANKKIDFNDYGLRYSAFNSLYNPRVQKEIKSIKYNIDCVSIDNYVEMNNIFPNFIKIDAESSEYDIIMGMEKTIKELRPMITIEVGDMDIKGIPKNRELLHLLSGKGYQAYEHLNGKIIKHKINDQNYMYKNILFIPC